MSVFVRCPECQAVRAASGQLRTHRVRCPECDSLVVFEPMLASDSDTAALDGVEMLDMDLLDTKRAPKESPLVILEEATPVNLAPPKVVVPPPPPQAPQTHVSALSTSMEEDEDTVKLGGRSLAETELDMTPMVDVTFLLLIFFMVTAAFSMQKALQVPKPNPDQPSTNVVEKEDEDSDTVTVIVDQFNTYQVLTAEDEFECPSEQELIIQLRRASGAGSGVTKLLVKAHIDAFHAKVVTALDSGALVGVNEVQLMTIEEDFDY